MNGMNECILCKQPTRGSVGAAGLKWKHICQPCKDKEDAILLHRVKVEAKITDVIFDDVAGDNFPANTIDRLAEYRQEAVTNMREEE